MPSLIMLMNIKLSEAQRFKIIQSGGFLVFDQVN